MLTLHQVVVGIAVIFTAISAFVTGIFYERMRSGKKKLDQGELRKEKAWKRLDTTLKRLKS